MVKMGTVWDRTTAFLGERAAPLFAIAAVLIFLPGAVQRALQPAMADPASAGGGLAYTFLALALVVLMFLGQLSVVALALDPSMSTTAAMRTAGRRLPVAIGLWLLLGVGIVVLMAPMGVALVASGVHFVSTGPGQWAPRTLPSSGVSLFVGLYLLAFVIILFWIMARLLPLSAVVVAERRGMGAFGRTFGLTRGLALRIVGVVILFCVVWAVCTMAATAVLGSIFQLAFGGEGAITLASVLTAAVSAAVAAAFAVISSAFGAELYLAVRAARDLPAGAK